MAWKGSECVYGCQEAGQSKNWDHRDEEGEGGKRTISFDGLLVGRVQAYLAVTALLCSS
jgi:hypothetical protein